jgi:putative component of toxin-antitoxin plasmid stabilization module
MYEIRHYLTEDDKDVYLEWLKIQRDTVAKIAIVKRINRIELGKFCDHEFCRDGVLLGIGQRYYIAVMWWQ